MNHLWFGMNLDESIAAKIVFVDANNNLNFEKGFNEVSSLEFIISTLTLGCHRGLTVTLARCRWISVVCNAVTFTTHFGWL